MERLTDNYDYCFLTCYEHEGDLCGEECPWYKNCHERQMFEKLKHYEDLEEQGYKMANINKIVEQLEDVSCYIEDRDGHAGHLVFTDEAIEIVKGGLKNE